MPRLPIFRLIAALTARWRQWTAAPRPGHISAVSQWPGGFGRFVRVRRTLKPGSTIRSHSGGPDDQTEGHYIDRDTNRYGIDASVRADPEIGRIPACLESRADFQGVPQLSGDGRRAGRI